MTLEMRYLLHVLGCTEQGKVPQKCQEPIDWERLFALAQEQAVPWLLVYALWKHPTLECPSDWLQTKRVQMRQNVYSYCIQREQIMKLLNELEQTGVQVVMLKGYVVAEEYKTPACRVSGDVDIYIDLASEGKVCSFLEGHGFSIEKRGKNSHHTTCIHPELGCIELHVNLYDRICEDIWFGKRYGQELEIEPWTRISFEDYGCNTLGKTDQMIFLALHTVKHLISSGASLKMFLDITLFYQHHAHEIDLERFWCVMEQLRYAKCIKTIMSAVITFGGFECTDNRLTCDVNESLIVDLLNDLEDGGCMGVKDRTDRSDGWKLYNKHILVEREGRVRYYCYMLMWQMHKWKGEIFPSNKVLAQKYPYIAKCPWLGAVAWLQRFISKGIPLLVRGKTNSRILLNDEHVSSSGKKRMDMLKEMDMF